MDNGKLMAIDYPVLATKGVALFPHNDISIEAGRVFSKRAIRRANELHNGYIFVVPQRKYDTDVISLDTISHMGTVAKIKSVRNYENGIIKVSVSGISRAHINNMYMNDGVYFANIELKDDIDVSPEVEAAYVRSTAKVLEEFISSAPNVPKSAIERLTKGLAAGEFTDVLAQSFVKDTTSQIELLNELDIGKRMELCISHLTKEKQIDSIEQEISEKVHLKE